MQIHPRPSPPSNMTTTTTMRVYYNPIQFNHSPQTDILTTIHDTVTFPLCYVPHLSPTCTDPSTGIVIGIGVDIGSLRLRFLCRYIHATPPHPLRRHHSRSRHYELYKPFSLPLFDPSPLSVVGLHYHQLPPTRFPVTSDLERGLTPIAFTRTRYATIISTHSQKSVTATCPKRWRQGAR